MQLAEFLNNYLLRHLQTMLFSLGQLWQKPLASLMTIGVIGIALALPSGLYVLLKNMNKISDQWDTSSQITLFLQQNISPQHTKDLTAKLQHWPEIAGLNYQSSEQSLAEFSQLSGLGNLLDSLPSNPLPAIIIITPAKAYLGADAIGSLLAQLEKLPQIAQAQLDMKWLQRLRSINKTIQRGITILGILLSLSVLLVIGNTIRLAILHRQSEIRVMKLVGATDRFVRRPFLYTGLWYGVLGGLFAWCTLLLTMSLISSPARELASHYGSDFVLQWFAIDMLMALPATGLSLGIFGAWLAVGRHIHSIEPN